MGVRPGAYLNLMREEIEWPALILLRVVLHSGRHVIFTSNGKVEVETISPVALPDAVWERMP